MSATVAPERRYKINAKTLKSLNNTYIRASGENVIPGVDDWTTMSAECGSCASDGCTCTCYSSCSCGGNGCSYAI